MIFVRSKKKQMYLLAPELIEASSSLVCEQNLEDCVVMVILRKLKTSKCMYNFRHISVPRYKNSGSCLQ
jgi:hypothetical protein